jgi:hypothetical protein
MTDNDQGRIKMRTVTQTFDPAVGPVLDAIMGGVPVRLLIATGAHGNILREGLFDRFAEGHGVAVVDVIVESNHGGLSSVVLRNVEFSKDEWPPEYTIELDGVIGSAALRGVTFHLNGPQSTFSLVVED